MIAIVTERINVQTVIDAVRLPAAGGIATFIGTTRNYAHEKEVLSLEYEAYQPMALKSMRQIADEARTRWRLHGVAIVHRLGVVGIGEESIVIAVSSSHRADAFEACRFIIDTLKKSVPIWKKERYSDGEVWIGEEGKPMTRVP